MTAFQRRQVATLIAIGGLALILSSASIFLKVSEDGLSSRGKPSRNFLVGQSAVAQTNATLTAPKLAKAEVGSDEIVAVLLDNLSGVAQETGYLTFGQVFAEGDLPANSGFAAAFVNGGGAIESQLDVKAYHADGGVTEHVPVPAA